MQRKRKEKKMYFPQILSEVISQVCCNKMETASKKAEDVGPKKCGIQRKQEPYVHSSRDMKQLQEKTYSNLCTIKNVFS